MLQNFPKSNYWRKQGATRSDYVGCVIASRQTAAKRLHRWRFARLRNGKIRRNQHLYCP